MPAVTKKAVTKKKGVGWTPEENIRRYRRILATPLTDLERQFIERRLAEEWEVAEQKADKAMSVHANAD